ncbi:MAG: hypothetical protein ACRDTP_01980 [Mycobacteriales bacterium]
MVTSTARLLARVGKRAETEPDAVLPALRVLAGEAPYDSDHPRPLDPAWKAVVVEINRARVLADRAEFVTRAWTTEKVAEHLGVRSRQAVAQRRQRGRLLGARIGAQTYYPSWQFGPEGLADGLGRLLDLLRESGIEDCREADNTLRMSHSELGGQSLLDVWLRDDWATLEVWLGDIGGWRR